MRKKELDPPQAAHFIVSPHSKHAIFIYTNLIPSETILYFMFVGAGTCRSIVRVVAPFLAFVLIPSIWRYCTVNSTIVAVPHFSRSPVILWGLPLALPHGQMVAVRVLMCLTWPKFNHRLRKELNTKQQK